MASSSSPFVSRSVGPRWPQPGRRDTLNHSGRRCRTPSAKPFSPTTEFANLGDSSFLRLAAIAYVSRFSGAARDGEPRLGAHGDPDHHDATGRGGGAVSLLSSTHV